MENNNWWYKPQNIKKWNKDIEYVMFVDENGNSGKINDISKKIYNNEKICVDDKYFTITGCIFDRKSYYLMRNNVRKLKYKYWNEGCYFDIKHNVIKYVCFHSREIRRHENAFSDAIIDYNMFINDLSKVMENINCKIISINIDLEKYVKSGEKLNVYEKSFDLLFDKYIRNVDNGKKSIIMLEARGKKEDSKLLKHISEIIFDDYSDKLKKQVVGVYFNPKWYDNYILTYAGLEIADLFSYPIHQFIKYKKVNSAFKIVEKKIVNYPKYIDTGIVIYPKEKND